MRALAAPRLGPGLWPRANVVGEASVCVAPWCEIHDAAWIRLRVGTVGSLDGSMLEHLGDRTTPTAAAAGSHRRCVATVHVRPADADALEQAATPAEAARCDAGPYP